MANVTFYLDHPFQKGIDIKIINQHKRDGKPLKHFFRDKELSIYMYMRVTPKLYKVNTNEKIHPQYWNFEKSEAKSGYIGCRELNERLLLLKSELLKRYRTAITLKPNISHDQIYGMIREIMVENLPNPVTKDFFEVYVEFMEDRSGLVKPHTIAKYKTILTILKEFQVQEKYTLTFDSINHEFISKFKKHLFGRKLLNDTVSKYVQGVQIFMNWTREREYHKNTDMLKVKIDRDKHDVIYLLEDELNKMYNLDLTKLNRLDKIRDIFCFLAFTGQRFSDGMNLKWENFAETENKELIWNLYQIKGNKKKSVKVPIREEAKLILNKYGSQGQSGFVFPRVSNVKANEYIKEVAKMCGIEEVMAIARYSGVERIDSVEPKFQKISMHTARRTFVTLSLEKGMRPEVVQSITGHEDYKTMKKYMGVNNKTNFKEFFDKVNS